ncbi:hypothetical protein E2C01_050497 [Portunus trituberculatus]|uniref:Uncharacterized protein n=1 Tax=Portunus trituberculatus TaxID=210409 RepID=A0A5B7GGJ8_PORTR|nr:hypothetical protein [Portunus trituberculatus]
MEVRSQVVLTEFQSSENGRITCKISTVPRAACSRAVHDREVAHKRYLSLPSPESHALYISAQNHAKSFFNLPNTPS